MTSAIHAELRKLATARTLLAAPALSVLFAVLAFAPALLASDADRAALPDTLLLDAARGPGFTVAILLLLMGALATAGEFRHGTVVATLLVTPRRRSVLVAKACAVALVAAGTAVAAEAVSVSLGLAYVRAHDLPNAVQAGDVAVTALAVVAGAVLYALAGAGLGLALRDQTAAVAAALAWVGIVEGLVPVVLRKPWLFRWLPGGAVNSLLGAADPPPDLLPAWAGALLLVGVAGSLLAAAAAAFTTRDVA